MRTSLILFLALAWSCALQSQNDYADILAEYYAPDEPGAAAIVAKGDQILYRGAIGKAEMELDVDARPEHIFRLGSITKQFTAVAILMLQEEGKLDVSDPMAKYLPEYPVGEHTITVEHLLTHTSGIQSYTDMPGFMQTRVSEDKTVDELIDVFKDEPMNFDPGEEWRYNNSGYILLGKIIEVVSGQSYEDFIEQRIFKPLGMSSSYYDNNDEIVANRIPGYSRVSETDYQRSQYISMTLPYAAGSLMSTVDDLLKWNTAVMNGKVVDEKLLANAFRDYELNDGSPCGYGYGWSLWQLKGLDVIEHGGGIFGFVTQGIYVPGENVYVAILTNTDGKSPAGAARRMAALASGVSLEFDEIEVPAESLEEYVGVYAIEGGDEKRVVTVRDGQLFTQRGEGAIFPVVPYGKDKFFYADSRTTIEFNRNDAGDVIGHTVTPVSSEAGHAMRTDEKIEVVETVVVDEDILRKYEGVYELMPGFDITLTLVNGGLEAKATGQGAFMLEAYDDRNFGFPPAGIKMEFPISEEKADYFILLQGGQERQATRKED